MAEHRRVESFPIHGFEELFSPRGMPLVVKGSSSRPTTSVLIRGGPGTGKTTLGLGIAHGIAATISAPVLYVGTEFVSTEVAFKLKALELPPPSLPSNPPQKASTFVEHLLNEDADFEPKSTTDRRRSTVDRVWELSETTGNRCSAIVLDALIAPDKQGDESTFRDEMLGLIQALESKGVSIVIIQEDSSESEWLSFLVDVVINITFGPTHQGPLIRKLLLPKSRFANSHIGPHDYGLDAGRPAVWSDPLPCVQGDPDFRRKYGCVSVPIVFAASEKTAVRQFGSLFVADFERDEDPLRLLQQTQGIRLLLIRLGPITHVDNFVSCGDWEGPFSVLWNIMRIAARERKNTVAFFGTQWLENNPDFAPRMTHVIESLLGLGFHVLLRGESMAMKKLMGTTPAYNPTGAAIVGSDLGELVRPLWAARWISFEGHRKSRPTLAAAVELVAHAQLERAEAAIASNSSGADLSWFYAFIGQVDKSIRSITKTIVSNERPDERVARQHAAMCAKFGASSPAVEWLTERPERAIEFLWLVVDALIASGERSKNDSARLLIELASNATGVESFVRARALAELELFSTAGGPTPESIAKLEHLAADAPSTLHRGEIFFNLFVASRKVNRERARVFLKTAREAHATIAQGTNTVEFDE
ncbi:MAG: ATPase domain-containing protein [Myxococcaceae bacterium]